MFLKEKAQQASTVCQKLNRDLIGFDKEQKHIDFAKSRIEQKTLGKKYI